MRKRLVVLVALSLSFMVFERGEVAQALKP